MNIVLVGFMGTGKTTVAKLIAEKLSLLYVSTDEFIESAELKSINEIFSEKGERYFRDVERKAVKEVSAKDGQVIDTGGGVILSPENITDLKRNGIMVCLWASPDVIYGRTAKFKHRPLLNVPDPKGRIKEILKSREAFYDQADFHINTDKIKMDEAAEKIIEIYITRVGK
ncbi:MAG: AAA family ATPase [Candidatus Omnitrophica bacterium]|nr:AAA family ATPase [Candidatus Omnitrophota bacterium]